MIGLLFFGAIGLWLMIALYLGCELPKWFGLNIAWAILFVPLVFFVPVIDEVIAIPQAYALCKQAEEAFWYDSSVKGGVLTYYDEYSRDEQTVGFNIRVRVEKASSVLSGTRRPVIRRMRLFFSAGFLGSPAGSSGTSMPLLLPESCPGAVWSFPKYQEALKLLELTSEPRPNL
ncbi:hypothetical protein ACWA7J_12985 [Leptothrix sp. BB-4]